MNRSKSRSKWKDVLGFDDEGAATTFRYTPYSAHSSTNLSTLTEELYPDFPRALSIIYHPNPAQRDLLIRAYLPPPKYGPEDNVTQEWLPKIVPLFYITVREDPGQMDRRSSTMQWLSEKEMQTSRPELLLHEGGRPSHRVLAQCKFHPVTMTTDITLSPASRPAPSIRTLSRATSHNMLGRPTTSLSDSWYEKPQLVLGKDDSGRPRYKIVRMCLRTGNGTFRAGRWSFAIEDESGRERYEWRKDKTGEKKRDLWCGFETNFAEGSSQRCQKLKLVNARSGNVVAGFMRSDDDNSLGLFRFQGDTVGGEFDVVAVMSLLSVVERGRRKGSNRLSRAFRNN